MFRATLDNDLELRLLENRHAGPLFALVDENRAYLREWLPWVDGTASEADTAAFIQSTRDQFAANNGFQAGIWFRGELAGVIGFHKHDWNSRATEIGYWLAARFQGNGIMTRCCRALVGHAFEEIGLNRVQIRCATGNMHSCAIPQRLGFTQEGVTADAEWLYDHFVDLVVYRMLAREWDDGRRTTDDRA